MQRGVSSQQPANISVNFQGSSGYKRLTSLWSAIITSKVTEALLATASSAIHSAKETLLDLSTEQVLLLCLIHSLIKKDTATCFALIEISAKVESLKSSYLQIWLKEEFTFSCNDIRTALGFAADLAKSGLPFPDLILSILENLYRLYCSPTKRNSYAGLNELDGSILSLIYKPLKTEVTEDTQRKSEPIQNKSEDSPRTPEFLPRIPEPPPRKPSVIASKPQVLPRKSKVIEQEPEVWLHKHEVIPCTPEPETSPSTPKVWPPHLPSRKMQGMFTNCEKSSREKDEIGPSPMVINSPLAPRYSGDVYNRYDKNFQDSNFIFHERTSSNVAAIKELAAEADAINEKTGDTALHLAVAKEDLRAVITLIQRGADIDARNKVDITPIQIAVERENLLIIKTLYEAGAEINQRNIKKESLLHIAAASCGLETIDLLIDLGIDLDSVDNRNQTPLFRATKKGYIVVMEKFEECGADIYAKDTFGRSLLHYAAWNGQTEAVHWLLEYGLEINEQTKHGWTPLHWAVANRQIQTAHLLLQRGANVNAKDSSGRTPLYWATEAGNLALIDLLSSYNGRC